MARICTDVYVMDSRFFHRLLAKVNERDISCITIHENVKPNELEHMFETLPLSDIIIIKQKIV